MSVTQGWSWAFVMTSSLYSQLRNLIYAKIVPPNISNYQYDGYTINLSFQTLTTKITVDMEQPNTLIITAPISGNMAPSDGSGVQVSFRGSAAVTVNLDELHISGAPNAVTFADAEGATWNNYLYMTDTAVTGLQVTLSSGTSAQDTLVSLFQTSIDDFMACSPVSLGTHTAENLNQFFAPTYQSFITLNDPDNANDPRVVLLAMANNMTPPASSSFDSEAGLMVPAGSNCVFAFDDYTLYEFVAQQIQASDNDVFDSVSVSQADPAVLTGKISKKHYSGALTSEISGGAISTAVSMSNAFDVNIGYATTVTLMNNVDGGQSIEITNDLVKSNVAINQSNAAVISLEALWATLVVLSPLSGVILYTVLKAIENAVINAVGKLATKLEFEGGIDIDNQGNGTLSLMLTDITLDSGITVAANISVVMPSTQAETPRITLKQQQLPMLGAGGLGMADLSEAMDDIHASIAAAT